MTILNVILNVILTGNLHQGDPGLQRPSQGRGRQGGDYQGGGSAPRDGHLHETRPLKLQICQVKIEIFSIPRMVESDLESTLTAADFT